MSSTVAKYFQQQFKDANNNGPFYLRFYIRIDTYPSADNTIAVFFTTAFAAAAYLKLSSAGKLRFFTDSGGGAQVGADSAVLSTGVQYMVELKFDASGVGATDAAEIKIDGSSVGAVTNHTISAGVAYLSLGGNLFGEAQTAGDWYYDDIALNDNTGTAQTSYPGSGKIVHLHPNAAGDNNAWLKQAGGAGDSNNFQSVDELTFDDATTYLKRTGTGTHIDDYNCEASSVPGIGAGDSITLVAVGGRIGATNATITNRGGIYRIKSAASGSVLESGTIDWSVNGWLSHLDGNSRIYQHTAYVDPTTGVAWTPTGTNSLDNMQIGFKNATSSTNEIRVSTLWALVEYVENAGSALTKDLADSVTIADVLSNKPGLKKTDTMGLSEQALQKAVGKKPSDAMTLSDALAKKTIKALLDAMIVAETLSNKPGLVKTDDFALADSLVKGMGIKPSDAVIIADTFARTWTVIRALADNQVISDALVKSAGKILADSMGITDSFAYTIILLLSLTDTMNLADTVVKTVGKGNTDTVTIADNNTKVFGKNATDTVTLTDSLQKAIKKALTDTQGMTDSLVKLAGLRPVDTIIISDALVKVAVHAITDVFTITDSLAKRVGLNKTETMLMQDALAKTIIKGITDRFWVREQYKYALNFDGVDDYASAADSATTRIETNNKFSTAFWVYLDAKDNNNFPRFWEKGSNFAAIVGGTGDSNFGRLLLEIVDTGNVAYDFRGTTRLNIGELYHIAITFDGSLGSSQCKMYINGVLETLSASPAWSATLKSTVGGTFWIARRGTDLLRNLDGRMDDFYLHRNIFTQANILSLMAGDPVTADVVWHMDEGTGTTSVDSSGNGNTLTISGAAWYLDNPGLVATVGKAFTDNQVINDALQKTVGKALTDIVNLADALAKAAGKNISDTVTITDLLVAVSAGLADRIYVAAADYYKSKRGMFSAKTGSLKKRQDPAENMDDIYTKKLF